MFLKIVQGVLQLVKTSRISNVLPGVYDNDVVIVKQLNSAVSSASTSYQSGLSIVEGSNETMGSFSALIDPVAGTDVVVNTNKITANSRVFLTVNSTDDILLTVPTVYVFSRSAGTSFTVRVYGDVAANITVAWLIIEPV